METAPAAAELILAPLKGFTDALFRSTFAEHFNGFDGAVAPFIASTPMERLHDRRLRDLLPRRNLRMKVEPQILGAGAEEFIHLARRLFDMGYPDVNWNLGCPFRPVTKKGRGAGLLAFPGRVEEFLERVVPAVPGRLSIKLRLGLTSPTDILRLIPVLNRYPLRQITLHPRTARQLYTGRPDLESFQVCLEMTRHPVVYNGDIGDAAAFRRLAVRFPGAAGWMIGRGALSNPFLAEAIKAGVDSDGSKIERFRAFYEDLFGRYREEFHGPGHLLDRMKGFWTYFGVHLKDGSELRKRIHRTFQLASYLETVSRYFEEDPAWVG
jgi:tRNA-dihydrouridine synthase B